jgi:four helix bundle protein
MKTFIDVLVWQKAMCFLVEIEKVFQIFLKEETFRLTAQLRRSVVSKPYTIFGGYCGEGVKGYLRFLKSSNCFTF